MLTSTNQSGPLGSAPLAKSAALTSSGLCIHQLFEKQAVNRGDAIALNCEGEKLTYRELNERANVLAHRLISLGIKTDALVALLSERSLDMVVGILAILKAGGAYLPLDPAYPKERLVSIIEDSGAKVVLTHGLLAKRVAHLGTIILSMDEEIASESPRTNPQIPCKPDQLAYVIYTSGSTGKPKGALITHHCVVRLFESTRCWFDFGHEDVWTLFHSCAFDFSVWEIWGALLHGGRLIVVPYLLSRSPREFYRLLIDEKVTVLNQTPSAFRQLTSFEELTPNPGTLNLRYIIFGGEALDFHILGKWIDRHGDSAPQLINMYGITETTVHVTYRRILSNDLQKNNGSLIGCPIPDLQIHLLDEKMREVALGEVGEMYVGGDGLARGYLNRTDLTAERFLSNPFSQDRAARLYKTGDLARRTSEGELQYLGRSDQQVKIRGFRIEPGEIQCAMALHSSIQEAVVLARDTEGDEEKRLVAYLVLKSPGSQNPAGLLREFLQERIPDYMIPSHFVVLDAIPLTSNGKVDQNALPSAGGERRNLNGEYIAPRSNEEKILSRIWSEVLDIHPIGIHDSFFELGGDSIRSIQILTRIQQEGFSLSLGELFERKTIANIAEVLLPSQPSQEDRSPVQTFELLAPGDLKIVSKGLEDAYPASKLQLGMLYHGEMSGDAALFHDIFSFQFRLPFDGTKLQSALVRLASRHSILRTSFDLSTFTQPLQLVAKLANVSFTKENLEDHQPAQQKAALLQWIENEKQKPFDWTKAPLFRFHAQLYGRECFQLLVSFHHAVLDGWSLAALVTELIQDYVALLKGSGESIQMPRTTYKDFISLELEAIASEPNRTYWKECLQDSILHVLPRWPKQYRGKRSMQCRGPEVLVPSHILEGLKAMAKNAEVPLRTVFLAAHFYLMGKLDGGSDIVTGLISNGRPEQVDGEKILGLFLNTLPLRQAIKDGSWTDLVNQTCIVEHQSIPYRRFPLQETKQMMGGNLLFEAAFDFVHFHVYRNLPNYQDKGFMEGAYYEANSFVLLTTVMLDVDSTQLQFHFDYDPSELATEQVEAFCHYYSATLAEMVLNPSRKHTSFSPLSHQEKQKMLVDWNMTDKKFQQETLIHELFEEQARKTPEAIALGCRDKKMTYRELNERANMLAHHLQGLGIGPGKYVAVYLSRSLEMIVALLGILKTGGAYVPIEPSAPIARTRKILASVQTTLVVTEIKYLRLFTDFEGHEACLRDIVCLDAPPFTAPSSTQTVWDLGDLHTLSRENVASSVRSHDHAYVIFTSGSTGEPKGVVVTHRPVINLIEWVNDTFNVGPSDTILFTASYAFDLSVYDIFGILASGGCIRIATEEETSDPEALLRILHDEPITFWDSAPASLQQLVPLFNAYDGKKAQLRRVFLSGDWISVGLPDSVRTHFTTAEVIALGGATEATVWSNFYRVKEVDPSWPSIPYGKPIQNARYYILDAGLNPSPTGAMGHLYIGGECLAAGYLNDQELTARKFIPNPFSNKPASRLYSTGDLARYLPDGTIEFLGRSDQQVKLRGYRIELGEIESILRQHPSVESCVVIMREDTPAQKQLVGYVTTRRTVAASELREFIATALPGYMVPSAIMLLQGSLPVTSNGKVDRKALPIPDENRESMESEYAPPRNQTEDLLAQIWSQLFHVKRIGIHDNFFELGGHSLLATQMISRVRSAFGCKLAIRSIFDAPTISQFTEIVEKSRLLSGEGQMISIVSQSRQV